MTVCAARIFVVMLVCLSAAVAQQPASGPPPLTVATTSLPNAYLQQHYRYQLEANGGVKPLRWRVEKGRLPPDMRLDEFGLLEGIPRTVGDFHFTVILRDSATPAHEIHQDLTLRVLAPLLAEWKDYPRVSGPQIAGSVLVSNASEHDFDLTFIAVAVNSIGRATALGYQHFVLKKGTVDMKLPFSGTPSRGSYQVDVDVVAEVKATGEIYRTHLQTNKNLTIDDGP